MFKFAIKNLLIKKLNVILIIVSIMLSAGTALLAFNTSEQVSDGITNTATFFSAVIGPEGSSTQLVMNTMYFTDEPLGTIPADVMDMLQADTRVATVKDENGQDKKDENGVPVKYIVPYAMADSYNGYNCVGTSTLFFEGKTLKDGEFFDDDSCMQVVVGYEVARACDLAVGDTIHTGHESGVEHSEGLTVVGILNRTYSAYDNIVFTQIETLWDLHESEEEHEEGEEHDHAHEGSVCAILVKTTNPATAMTLVNEYNKKTVSDDDGDTFTLQACEPMSVVRNVLNDADSTKYIVYVLCGIILVMNILVICIITLLNMNYSAKEIRLMRLIGVSMKKISLLYVIENGIIGLCATVFAFLTSKLCAGLVSGYVADMGVVLDRFKVYPMEFAIMAGVLVITVLPTLICTKVIGEKDAV